MNEKIKQLAEQAGSTHKQSLGVYQFYADELQQFVELIIQECISACATDRLGKTVGVEDLIKQHFGVKE